jgi:hypothetical protein
MSHPPPDRFHRHFQTLYALERYLYIPFALFTILLKYVRFSQGIRKLCGTAIIPRLTAIHRPINRVSSGRRKIESILIEINRDSLLCKF